MDHHADVDAARKKAIHYLQDLLENTWRGKSSLQTAEGIVGLAYDHPNPLKDVFAAADRPSTAQPADSLKSSLSKLLRRDNKNGSSESKALGSVSSVCDVQAQPPGTSALYAEIFGDPPFEKSALTSQSKKNRSRSIGRAGPSKTPVKQVPNSHHVFSSSSTSNQPACATQYKCIICQEQLSSKGVCKRHLDEQHVTPNVYQCEKCAERFDVKKAAKKHVDACGQGVFSYTINKPEQKKIYACEFTGESFVSKSKYVEHLLGLSERTEERPSADQRLKLCALLNQSSLRSQVAEISSRKFESRHAWRNLQWSDAHVTKAIEELEYATVREDGAIYLGKSQTQKSIRIYLNSLLGAGSLLRSTSQHSKRSRSSTLTQRRAPLSSSSGRATPTQETNPVPQIPMSHQSSVEALNTNCNAPNTAPEPILATMSVEMRSKRPLSEQSRAFDPGRLPPGPPIMSQMTYGVSPSMPDIQQYALPNTSTSTLAIRTQESTSMIDQTGGDMYSQRTGSTATPTLSSDAASELTLMSNYQEPEFVNQTPIDYNYNDFWSAQQSAPNYPIMYPTNMNYDIPAAQYFYPSGDPSIRTSSIATDQTYVVDYNEHEQKLANFEPFPSHDSAQYGPTFFLEGDDDFHDLHG